MVEITGTDDSSKWVGHTITLTPSWIDRERQTITITPAPASAGEEDTGSLSAVFAKTQGRLPRPLCKCSDATVEVTLLFYPNPPAATPCPDSVPPV